MVLISLNLTKAQLDKLNKSKTFQLKNSQLTGSGNGHRVDLDVPKAFHTKVKRAMTKGSGLRIPKYITDGLKKEAIGLKDAVVRHATSRANAGIDTLGKMAKRKVDSLPIPRIMKNSVNAYLGSHIDNAAGNAKNQVGKLSNRITEYGHTDGNGFNFGNALKSIGKVALPIVKTVAPAITGKVADMVVPGSGKVVSGITSGVIKSTGGSIMQQKMAR